MIFHAYSQVLSPSSQTMLVSGLGFIDGYIIHSVKYKHAINMINVL